MTLPSPFFQSNTVQKFPAQDKVQPIKPTQENHPKPDFRQPRNFTSFCKYCQEGFNNDTELFQHRRNHTKCPYDDCKFNANEMSVSNHVQRVHLKQNSLVKIQDLTTPEQIEKWREERRKRYPTTQNVILRQQIQEERQQRGEKLNDSKKRFGDNKQRDFVKNLGKNDNNNKGNKQNRHNQHNNNRNQQERKKNFQQKSKPRNELPDVKKTSENKANSLVEKQPVDKTQQSHPVQFKKPQGFTIPKSESSDEDDIRGTPKFQGTSSMKNYHTVEAIVKEKPALSVLEMYGSDSDDESLDSARESTEKTAELTNKTAENYPESIKNEAESENVPASPGSSKNDQSIAENIEFEKSLSNERRDTDSQNDDNLVKSQESNVNKQEDLQELNGSIEPSDDDAPDELPILKDAENDNQSNELNQRTRKRKRNDSKQSVPVKVVRKSGLDYSKLRNRSVNPFLEKLLERDIVHERNVLLQCVNFVVKNDFFGIGQTEGSPE